MICIETNVESPLWQAFPDLDAVCDKAVAAAIHVSDCSLHPEAEISILFADDARVQALNTEWRGISKPTNVLSFPASVSGDLSQALVLGDVVLAFETLDREAQAEGKTLHDHAAHLLVHGVLHLLGFDHENDVDAEEMEACEVRALATLGIANPY